MVGEAAHSVVGEAGDRAESLGPILTMQGAPLAFHVMAKPTGAICNLDCEYCFFRHVSEPMRQMAALLRAGRARGSHSRLRGRRLAARPQRALPLRQRPQVETLLRH